MLTFEEIKKIGDYLTEVFKDVFVTKEEFNIRIGLIDTKLDHVISSVDSLAKNYKDIDQETKVLGHRVDRQEKWTIKAGKKIDLPFNI